MLLINGCASTSKKPAVNPSSLQVHQQHLANISNINTFSIKGRMGVIIVDKGFSGRLEWQHFKGSDYLEIYSGVDENEDGRMDDFESFVDPEFRTALIFAKMYEKAGYILGTGEIRAIQNSIDHYLTETLPDRYSFKIAGEPSIFVALSDYVVNGQLVSLFFCLFAVGLIIALLFKNWKAGCCNSY